MENTYLNWGNIQLDVLQPTPRQQVLAQLLSLTQKNWKGIYAFAGPMAIGKSWIIAMLVQWAEKNAKTIQVWMPNSVNKTPEDRRATLAEGTGLMYSRVQETYLPCFIFDYKKPEEIAVALNNMPRKPQIVVIDDAQMSDPSIFVALQALFPQMLFILPMVNRFSTGEYFPTMAEFLSLTEKKNDFQIMHRLIYGDCALLGCDEQSVYTSYFGEDGSPSDFEVQKARFEKTELKSSGFKPEGNKDQGESPYIQMCPGCWMKFQNGILGEWKLKDFPLATETDLDEVPETLLTA